LVWTGAALVAGGDYAWDPAADRWWRLPAPGGWTWIGQGGLVRHGDRSVLSMLVPAAG
jgi:hypothetical protein